MGDVPVAPAASVALGSPHLTEGHPSRASGGLRAHARRKTGSAWFLHVYGRGGFTPYDDQQLAAQLSGWAEAGIPRVKMKVGRDPAADLHRLEVARNAIGDDVALCDARSMDLSLHCGPQVSAHVGTAVWHLRHLEYFHDHVRIEGLAFDGVLDPQPAANRSRPPHRANLPPRMSG